MTTTEYTHCIHLNYTSGRCFLEYNGARGEVKATSKDGVSRIWPESENTDGRALASAMAWCRGGCKPARPEKSKQKTENKGD